MKKFAWFGLGVLISLGALCVFGCKNSYENMIEDFDKKYFVPENKEIPEFSIKASGFNADSMLESRYIFVEEYEVTLPGPAGGTSYKWELHTNPVYTTETKDFSFIPETNSFVISKNIYHIESSETKLVLTVTDASGTEYIDTTKILISSRD